MFPRASGSSPPHTCTSEPSIKRGRHRQSRRVGTDSCLSSSSDRLQKRYLFIAIDIALCLVGFVINIAPSPMGLKFFGLFLCAAGSYAGIPSVVTWLGNNLSGQTKRGVGMAFQIVRYLLPSDDPC